MGKGTRERGATAATALDIAENLVQTRGFNGFSYADIARELDVTNAALHYHFAGKAELGEALIDRYTERFAGALADLDSGESDGPAKLGAYVDLYRKVLSGDRMCLCGMLAAEHETLPVPVREAVLQFFRMNENWLAGVLDAGRGSGALSFDGDPADVAKTVISSLEGAMLMARLRREAPIFEAVAEHLLTSLATQPATPPSL